MNRKFPKDGDSMTYDEKESIVFESTTSCAQFYCRAEHVPLWHIERQ